MARVPHLKFLARAVEGQPPVAFRDSDGALVMGRFVGLTTSHVRAPEEAPLWLDKSKHGEWHRRGFALKPDGDVLILTHANRHEYDRAEKAGHITLTPIDGAPAVPPMPVAPAAPAAKAAPMTAKATE